MSYTIRTFYHDRPDQEWKVGTLEEASNKAQVFVSERMEAFGEDQEALKQYGFIDAENQALDMTDWGTKITLQDGWTIEVINNDIKE